MGLPSSLTPTIVPRQPLRVKDMRHRLLGHTALDQC